MSREVQIMSNEINTFTKDFAIRTYSAGWVSRTEQRFMAVAIDRLHERHPADVDAFGASRSEVIAKVKAEMTSRGYTFVAQRDI